MSGFDWVDLTTDHQATAHARQLAHARVAAAEVWPFLSAARTEAEYDSRLYLAEDALGAAVASATDSGTLEPGTSDQIREELLASLKADWTIYSAAQAQAESAARIESALEVEDEPEEHDLRPTAYGGAACKKCGRIWTKDSSIPPSQSRCRGRLGDTVVDRAWYRTNADTYDGIAGRMSSAKEAVAWSPASGKNQKSEPKPWQATHVYHPIGWDQFDAKPHPESGTVAPGSSVMLHGKMDPSGTLMHISDASGNHQTVDKRSISKASAKSAGAGGAVPFAHEAATRWEEGKTYRVVKPGASLEGMTHSGGSSWTGWGQPLSVGTELLCKGYKRGFGDSPDIVVFETPKTKAAGVWVAGFSPSSWGTPVPGYLEEVGITAQLASITEEEIDQAESILAEGAVVEGASIKGTPPMKHTWERVSPDYVKLHIEHADHQSFSRAVDPSAMRKARAKDSPIRNGTWAVTDAQYAHTDPAERRTISTFHFNKQSSAVARVALDLADDSGQRCPSCGHNSAHWQDTGKTDEDGDPESVLVCSNCDYNADQVEHTSSRVSCRKCVAGADPSGGTCDYCDGQGALDATLAMVKAADGWNQGITAEAFRKHAGRTVHTFDDSGTGYDQTQTDDSIHDGDVLTVPSEGIYGFLYKAWPVAVVGGPGEFHAMSGEDAESGLTGEGYGDSIAQARALAGGKTSSRKHAGDFEVVKSVSGAGETVIAAGFDSEQEARDYTKGIDGLTVRKTQGSETKEAASDPYRQMTYHDTADGAARYQPNPPIPKPDWIHDEWDSTDDAALKKILDQGRNKADPVSPVIPQTERPAGQAAVERVEEDQKVSQTATALLERMGFTTSCPNCGTSMPQGLEQCPNCPWPGRIPGEDREGRGSWLNSLFPAGAYASRSLTGAVFGDELPAATQVPASPAQTTRPRPKIKPDTPVAQVPAVGHDMVTTPQGPVKVPRDTFTQPQPVHAVSAKVAQMVPGIRAANPGLDHAAATALALSTIATYPRMVGK